MGIFDRLFGKRKSLQQKSRTDEIGDEVIEIAKRNISPSTDLEYFFVCSGNQSIIEAYHNIFRVGAPAYGGSAKFYRYDRSDLANRKAEEAGASLFFGGQSLLGSTQSELAYVTDVLTKLESSSSHGNGYIAFVSVGNTGRAWIQEVYTTLMEEAVQQGILPFHMYTTTKKEAAQFLLDSFKSMSR